MPGFDTFFPKLVIEDGLGNVVLDQEDSSLWNGASFDPPDDGSYTATLSLDTGPHQGVIQDSTSFTVGLPAATCKGLPATIIGTGGLDVINGTAGDDVIAGMGGDDAIDGLGEMTSSVRALGTIACREDPGTTECTVRAAETSCWEAGDATDYSEALDLMY